MPQKGYNSGAGSWTQNLNIKYSPAAGKKFNIPKSKLYRFLPLSKLEHLISIIIFNRVWFDWSDQDQNRAPYQMLHKKTEPPPYHEAVHKTLLHVPRQGSSTCSPGTGRGSLLVRGRFNLDYQDALLERREHMPGTQLIRGIIKSITKLKHHSFWSPLSAPAPVRWLKHPEMQGCQQRASNLCSPHKFTSHHQRLLSLGQVYTRSCWCILWITDTRFSQQRPLTSPWLHWWCFFSEFSFAHGATGVTCSRVSRLSTQSGKC